MHCQHAVGLGHLTRSLALAAALAERFRVVVSAAEQCPRTYPLRPASRSSSSLRSAATGRGAWSRSTSATRSSGRGSSAAELLVDAARALRPAVVAAELFPFGRRAFAGEIQALIDEARAQPAGPALIACSVRDILVGRGARAAGLRRARVRPGQRALRRHPGPLRPALRTPGGVLPAADAAALARLLHRLRHERRLGRPRARRRATARVVVSAGGGSVGASLLHAALDAQPVAVPRRRLGDAGDRGPVPRRRGMAASCARVPLGATGSSSSARCPTFRPSCGAPPSRSASAATTPPSTSYARACRRSSSPTPRPARTSRRAAPSAWSSSAPSERSPPTRLDGPALARAVRALRRSRPPAVDLDMGGAQASAEILSRLHAPTRDRGRTSGGGRMRLARRRVSARRSRRHVACADAVPQAPVASARRRLRREHRPRAGRAREAVAARARARRDRGVAARSVRPEPERHAAAAGHRRARRGHRARRGARGLLLRPVALQRGRAHHAHAARRGLRAPPPSVARLSPANPEGRPRRARDRGRHRGRGSLRRVARHHCAGRAAADRHGGRDLRDRPRPRARRLLGDAGAGAAQLPLPRARAPGGACPARARGRDRLARRRGALRHGRGQGVGLGALRGRARARAQRRAHAHRHTRSRASRPASTA